jgi:prephenate dehydrogenase
MGGSLALALRAAGRVSRVVGYDAAEGVGERARARGIVDESVAEAAEAVRGAELVILAVPVRATEEVCRSIAAAVSPDALVMDVGSTKANVIESVERVLPRPERFVAAHPICGTERSGPEAADGNLFRGRRCLLTPTARTRPDSLAAARALWRAVGAEVLELEAAHHDRVLAWVSHLPHVAAFALASAVGAAADGDPTVEGMSGGGFVDTTRIAASDPSMWRDILVSNREAVLVALDGLEQQLAELRRAIESEDANALEELIVRARQGRRRVLAR